MLQLVGEYVVEIIDSIDIQLAESFVVNPGMKETYGRFVTSNPGFLEITEQRVISYWNCYYRRRWPNLARVDPGPEDYPGFRVLARLRRVACG